MVGCVSAVLIAQEYKGKPEQGSWMFRHKSLGLLTGLLVAPRVAAKLATRAPEALRGSGAVEHVVAKVSHWAMYGFMIAMPASGIAMGYYGGKGLPFFYTTFAGAQGDAKRGDIAKQAFGIHKQLGTYGKFLIPVHVGAAGMHAVRGQQVFKRINPFASA
eukprot:g3867.t1